MKALTRRRFPPYSPQLLRLHRLLVSRRPRIALDVDGNPLTFLPEPAPEKTGYYLRFALYACGARL